MIQIQIAMLDKSLWRVAIDRESLDKYDGLRSSKVMRLDRQTGDLQIRHVLIKPYYRRVNGDDIVIFAKQVRVKS